MATSQNTLTSEGSRTIEEIRKSGLDNQLKERIAMREHEDEGLGE